MATTVKAHNAAVTGFRARVLNAIERMQENRARRVVYRQTLRELNGLSNRELNDLGISRAMITRLAHEAAYGVK
ncbi:DUF1127 domain-containing protein [Paracoccus sp. (in: a-proteobacteria)]|uniref:DUF1127 domain-containing protein n=1 Tax=Paracoccus sp. TaxID=267 RepID=UPI003A8B8A11